MRIVLIIVFCFSFQILIAQVNDTVRIVSNRPLKNGFVIKSIDTVTSYYVTPSEGIEINSIEPNQDSVFAIANGKVSKVQEADDGFICVVRTGNLVFAYTGLNSCHIREGDVVKRNGYIGEVYAGTGDKKKIYLVIRKNDRKLRFAEYINILNNGAGN